MHIIKLYDPFGKQAYTFAVQHNYDKRFVSSDLRIAFGQFCSSCQIKINSLMLYMHVHIYINYIHMKVYVHMCK